MTFTETGRVVADGFIKCTKLGHTLKETADGELLLGREEKTEEKKGGSHWRLVNGSETATTEAGPEGTGKVINLVREVNGAPIYFKIYLFVKRNGKRKRNAGKRGTRGGWKGEKRRKKENSLFDLFTLSVSLRIFLFVRKRKTTFPPFQTFPVSHFRKDYIFITITIISKVVSRAELSQTVNWGLSLSAEWDWLFLARFFPVRKRER